tara:strand:+ start:1217 stop:1594 length:378 start_codon:yes stop_codon:yes gene_type:complete
MSDNRLTDLSESPQPTRAAIICKDGFTMSVQASNYHYCTPKINDAKGYLEVEIGYPSKREPLIDEYAEGFGLWIEDGDKDYEFTNTVYPYVPAEVVIEVIMKHGGMVGGNLPNLDLSNLSNNEEE